MRDYEDERVWMRPGCTGGRRQANVWYSGPTNGILIDGWAEEIVGLQTATAGLPACRGRKCFLLGSTQARNCRVQGGDSWTADCYCWAAGLPGS